MEDNYIEQERDILRERLADMDKLVAEQLEKDLKELPTNSPKRGYMFKTLKEYKARMLNK